MDADAKRKKPIAKLLQTASLDLDAARRLLADPPNVLAANHLQQAAEKIISAVRLHRGLLNTKDHDLVILVDGRPGGEPRPLPEGDPWRDRFRPLEPLSAYATTFRYSLSPTPKIEYVRVRVSSTVQPYAQDSRRRSRHTASGSAMRAGVIASHAETPRDALQIQSALQR